MEILKLIALLLGTALIFVSCSASSAPTLSYQEKYFRAQIRWQTNDICATAFFTSVPHAPDSSGSDRTISLEFTSPESLEGLRISKRNGVISADIGGICIESPYAASLLAVSELFAIDATVKKSSVTTLDGKKLNLIEAVSSNGKNFTLFLFPESGLPRRICAEMNGESCVLDVLSFEFNDE